jgi:hypothetical protein
LKKAFVGEVKQPGMSYNIQNEFHMQGYFGVKVTPLGSRLTLLEEQEEGELQALMKDAKEWLEDWFQDIRPWSSKEIDSDRIVWLRIYGIPVHAWNDQFFAKVSKPWGIFMNTDEVTSKKLSLDVARLLIRTSCQFAVNEFLDVKINGEVFHLRIIEDSYGPMRILMPHTLSKATKENSEDEDEEEEEEDEEEEEEEGSRPTIGDVEQERGSEGEGENLWAINSFVNSHNERINGFGNNVDILNDKVIRENDSCNSNNATPILNVSVTPLNERGGSANLEGGTDQQNSLNVNGGILLGQEGGVDGLANSTSLHQTITGGVVRRLTQSENLGCGQKPNFLMVRASGGKGGLKGGVYSDGPSTVYKKLNGDPKSKTTPLRRKNFCSKDMLLPSASLRTQHRIVQALGSKTRKAQTNSTSSIVRPHRSIEGPGSSSEISISSGVKRNPPSNLGKISTISLSSAGEILCCSSINSSDIRNCNNNFLKKHNIEVASKVWKGAVELGVVGDDETGCYVDRIVTNEGREADNRIHREHGNQSYP